MLRKRIYSSDYSAAKRLEIVTRLLRIPRGPTRPYVAIWQIGSQLQIARFVHGPREYLPWHTAEQMLVKLERGARISRKAGKAADTPDANFQSRQSA